jgi:hypothetical protein
MNLNSDLAEGALEVAEWVVKQTNFYGSLITAVASMKLNGPIMRRQRASVAASNALLDRGYGKPVAPIEMDHHVDEFDQMTEEELSAWILERHRSSQQARESLAPALWLVHRRLR